MITKMKKLTFLVYHKEYEALLAQIRELGVVHVVERQCGDVYKRQVADFKTELYPALSEDDKKLIDLFYLKFDNANVLKLLKDKDTSFSVMGYPKSPFASSRLSRSYRIFVFIHDFENDPIETYIDGDWVKAKGTTLGADDGMGVAAIKFLCNLIIKLFFSQQIMPQQSEALSIF